jgi:hypothetical protein
MIDTVSRKKSDHGDAVVLARVGWVLERVSYRRDRRDPRQRDGDWSAQGQVNGTPNQRGLPGDQPDAVVREAAAQPFRLRTAY